MSSTEPKKSLDQVAADILNHMVFMIIGAVFPCLAAYALWIVISDPEIIPTSFQDMTYRQFSDGVMFLLFTAVSGKLFLYSLGRLRAAVSLLRKPA